MDSTRYMDIATTKLTEFLSWQKGEPLGFNFDVCIWKGHSVIVELYNPKTGGSATYDIYNIQNPSKVKTDIEEYYTKTGLMHKDLLKNINCVY